MIQKNEGPCSVQNCDTKIGRFRKFTSLAYEKAQKMGTYTSYAYLTVGQQICHKHYLSIVEPNRNQKLKALTSIDIDKENVRENSIEINKENITCGNNYIIVHFFIV